MNESDEKEEVKARRKDMLWRLAHMVGDGILGMHWSVKGGIGLSEPVIGVIGLFGACVGAWQKWKNME